jgi:hypothetical protein
MFSGLLVLGLMAASSQVSPASAAPIADAPTSYCSHTGTDPSMDTGAGTMISCDTTITNTVTAIDPVSGIASGTAVVEITECRGPANGRLAPSDLTCTTDTANLVGLVTHVDQCNGVGYGGGNVLECSVNVVNEFVGVTPQAISAATVNQCNGSAPDTTGCDPFPANTTSATITQCDNSSYGGGQEDFDCTASGTTTASLSVTVNQCNDSNYGGGSWLTCSASVSNTVIGGASPSPTTPADDSTTPSGSTPPSTTTSTGGGTPNPTPPATSTDTLSVSGAGSDLGTAVFGAAFLFIASLIVAQRLAAMRRRTH